MAPRFRRCERRRRRRRCWGRWRGFGGCAMNSPDAWARCALPTLRPWVHGETVGWAKAEGRAHAGFCFGLSPFGPLRKRRVGGRAQRGARQDVEQASSGPRFLCGGPVDAPPEHGTPPGDRSRSERRGRRGVLSFGDFSLDKQRKVTRRRGAAEPLSAPPKDARPSALHRKNPDRSPNAWARYALPTLRPWVHGETVGWAKAEGRAHAGTVTTSTWTREQASHA